MNHEEELDRMHARLHRMSCENEELRKRRDDLLKANNVEVEKRRLAQRQRDRLLEERSSALAAASAAAGHEIGLWPMGAVVRHYKLNVALQDCCNAISELIAERSDETLCRAKQAMGAGGVLLGGVK